MTRNPAPENIFDEMDRQHLIDERDEVQAEVAELREALRRIASGSGTLTATEQGLAAQVGASDESSDALIARYALADEYELHQVEPCPTVPVDIGNRVVNLDAGIAPLVIALNRVPGVGTVMSCEGHPTSLLDPRAWVDVKYEGVEFGLQVRRADLARLTALVERMATGSTT